MLMLPPRPLSCALLTISRADWTSAVEEWNSSRCIRVIQSPRPEKCCLSAAVSVSSASESRRYRPAFTQGTDTFAAWSTLSCVVHSQSVHGSLELKAFVYSTDGIEVMVVYGVLWGSWSVYISPLKKVLLAFPLIKDVFGYFALNLT